MKYLKRAQGSGLEVSIFIMLMILFIIIYVILLPPAERDVLLSSFEEGEGYSSAGLISIPGKIVLSEIPGKMFPYTTDKQTNNLGPLHLYVKEETKTQALAKSLSVSKNVLKDNYKDIYFDLPDIDAIESVKLLFLVTESKGKIAIKINNHIIFDGPISTSQLPIEIPKSQLKKSNNKLTLKVNSPMPNFFSTNYYLLEDVNLIKEISAAYNKATKTFFLDTDLKVKKSTLAWFVNCNTFEEEGILKIMFNNNLILEDKVFCEYLSEREIDLNKEFFSRSGNNKLAFEIDKGDYNFDKVKVATTLGKASYPSYIFEIDSDMYKAIKEKKKHAKIYFDFNDATTKKSATVGVQGKEFFFETTSGSYSKEISNYIADGSNYIRILPKTPFEVTKLRVSVE